MSTTETFLLIVDEESTIPFSNLLLLCRAIKAEKKYSAIRRKLLKSNSASFNGYGIKRAGALQTTKHVKK